MPTATLPTVTVPAAAPGWTQIAAGAGAYALQLQSSSGVRLYVGTAKPADGVNDGPVLDHAPGGRNASVGLVAGETLYGRSLSGTADGVVAVTKAT